MQGRRISGAIGVVVAVGVAAWAGPARAQEQEAAPPPPAAAGDQPLGEEEAMVLNFERADIREVIHSLATALGISYTIDPRIEGQVTIRTNGKIAREDLFPLFNQILRNNGIAAVKVGDIYQILPVAEAKTRAIVPPSAAARQGARATDSFVIEIFPVRHVSSDEMVNILQPFVTPGGDALSYPRSNLVVVTDLQSNVARLHELVISFDTDVFHNLHARVFKMQYGDPDELANEILGLLAPYGVTPTGEGEGGVFLIPLSRLNSIVAIAFDPIMFTEIERWLKLLDIPPEESAGRQTFVYPVENAKAADLAAVLNELFGGGPGGGGGGGLGRVPGGAPAGIGLFGAGGVGGGGGRGGFGGGGGGGGGRRGLTAAGGGGFGGGGGGIAPQQAAGGVPGAAGGGFAGRGAGAGGRLGGRGGIGGAAGGAGVPGAVPGAAGGARGISLPGGPAGAPGAPGQPQGPPPIFKQEVRIVADDVTNSLVVLATKRDYQLILDVVKRLDVVPRQVVLEVTIAEITLNKDLAFGVEYALAEGRLNKAIPGDFQGNSDPNTVSLFKNRAPGSAAPGAHSLGGLVGTASRLPTTGAFAVLSDRNHFNIFINALQGRTNVKMLSTPHIVAADNREAHILVGQSIPILTSSSTSTGLTGTVGATINAVQYRDTGKILTILPQVNSKGLVNLQVRQEVSAVLAGPSGLAFGNTNSPAFSTREAETTVVVQDGDSVLIGGIIDDTITHTRTGIPFMMDIPVFGRLFRTETDNTDRTELIVLITPYVIRNRDEAREVTGDFTDRIEGFKRLQDAMRAKHRPHAPSADAEPVPGSAPPARPPDVVPPEAAP
ncbi:MAG: type II secretion system protein GspD [Deltaproteobacteria bacterium]|nr:MAG: type II secretion system protein GspD [Deltaproteobacteria bacterium]